MNKVRKWAMSPRFLLSYLNPLAGCPKIGRIKDADSLWTLAFGRNKIADAMLPHVLSYYGAGKDDDLEVFKRLKENEFDPGAANYRLAQQSMRLIINHGLLFSGQWEVNYAMWEHYPHKYEELHAARKVKAFWPPADKSYYSSWDVLNDMINHADGIRTCWPVIMAHDNHLARVVAIAWRLRITPVTVGPVAKVMDPDSVQPGTRRMFGLNPLTCWFYRETIARYAHHPLKRWVRFSPPRS